MATRLKNILRFVAVGPGATAVLPHGLNWLDEQDQIPDLLALSASGFTVAANATSVSVTNTGAAPASVDVYCELWHTIERDFGPVSVLGLVPRPFVIAPGTGGGAAVAYLPDVWEILDVFPGLVAQVVPSSASQLTDQVTVNRALSVLGLRTRLTAPVTGGSLVVTVTVNGAPTAALVTSTSISNPSGGGVTLAPGVVSLVAGDLVGVVLDTDGGLLPADGSIDLSAWVEVG